MVMQVESLVDLGYFAKRRVSSLNESIYHCCISSRLALEIAERYPNVQGFVYEYGQN
jgi:hypothetical protein